MQYRSLQGPISVQVEITGACNLDCVHCYNHWREKTQPICTEYLDKAKMSKIVDILIEEGISSVTLTGGEPLQFWKILPDAIKRLTEAGISVGLNSNLTLLTNEMATAIKQSGLKNILTSVLCSDEGVHDSITCRKGSWQKTINGIKKAREFGFQVSSNMVLMKPNIVYLRDTARLMKELGISSFCATKASPALNSRNFEDLVLSRDELRESLNELVQIQKDLEIKVDVLECYPLCLIGDVAKYSSFARHSCTAGVTTCTIGSSGDVRPCSHADMVYGNIFESSLADIWKKMSDWRDGRYIPNECHSCEFVERCSGGCRMEAKYHGNISGVDPFMSGPSDVILSLAKKQVQALPKRLRISKSLKIRDESFGATISIKGRALLINTDAVSVVKELLKQSEFDSDYLVRELGLEASISEHFLRSLLSSGIIEKAT